MACLPCQPLLLTPSPTHHRHTGACSKMSSLPCMLNAVCTQIGRSQPLLLPGSLPPAPASMLISWNLAAAQAAVTDKLPTATMTAAACRLCQHCNAKMMSHHPCRIHRGIATRCSCVLLHPLYALFRTIIAAAADGTSCSCCCPVQRHDPQPTGHRDELGSIKSSHFRHVFICMQLWWQLHAGPASQC